MNAYLKEIAGISEIEKTLTFHIARHTFGTMVILYVLTFISSFTESS